MNNQSSAAPTVIFWVIALVLGLLGFAFLIAAAQGNALVRLIMGGGCLAGAGSLIYLARMRPVQHTHIHKMEVDLPGEVNIKSYECKSCGATLDSSFVKVVAGAIQVDCPYCGTSYQMEEQPKW
jgi:DNA-directed RNA polymerase subunit RPC12/RpoP